MANFNTRNQEGDLAPLLDDGSPRLDSNANGYDNDERDSIGSRDSGGIATFSRQNSDILREKSAAFGMSSAARLTIGYTSIALMIFCWVIQSELLQVLQDPDQVAYNKPWILNWFTHSVLTVGLLLWPLAQRDVTAVAEAERSHTPQPIKFKEMLGNGIWLAWCYHFPNWLWTVSLPHMAVAEATAIFNCSCAFVYVFSIILLGDSFNWIRTGAVVISILGVMLISYGSQSEDNIKEGSSSATWDIVILIGGIAFALYAVLYKKYVRMYETDQWHGYHKGKETMKNRMPMSFVTSYLGAVGLGTLLTLWVPLPFLDWTGLEPFQMPTWRQFGVIFGNSLLTVTFDASYMIALVFCPSPLYVSVAILATIPAAALADIAFRGYSFSFMTIVGCLLVIGGLAVETYKEFIADKDNSNEDANDEDHTA
eukprot:Clim_evm9s87 gene=Clim_evmTU9s87